MSSSYVYIRIRRLHFCFFKQKTAYEMRISDWSSDVCSSDLPVRKDAFDKTWRRRNPILLLIATPWHVSKAMMARAGAQETENAPSAVRPDKRLPRCTGGKTFCRPFISYFFPPQRL